MFSIVGMVSVVVKFQFCFSGLGIAIEELLSLNNDNNSGSTRLQRLYFTPTPRNAHDFSCFIVNAKPKFFYVLQIFCVFLDRYSLTYFSRKTMHNCCEKQVEVSSNNLNLTIRHVNFLFVPGRPPCFYHIPRVSVFFVDSSFL